MPWETSYDAMEGLALSEFGSFGEVSVGDDLLEAYLSGLEISLPPQLTDPAFVSKAVSNPLAAGKALSYGIPIPFGPIPIPAGVLIDAAEGIVNLGGKALDWIEGGPQQRRRAEKRRERRKLAIHFFAQLLGENPELFFKDKHTFEWKLKNRLRDPKRYSPPFRIGDETWTEPPQEGEVGADPKGWGWTGYWIEDLKKQLVSTAQGRQWFDALKQRAMATPVARGPVVPARTAPPAAPQFSEKQRQDLIKLHGMIEAQKRQTERTQRGKDLKVVVEGAKRGSKKVVKALDAKAKELQLITKDRVKGAIQAKTEVKKLEAKVAQLQRQLQTVRDPKKQRELRAGMAVASDQAQKMAATNIVGGALAKNAAVQAVIAEQIAQATAARRPAAAAVLTRLYNHLSDTSSKLKDIRQTQISNWNPAKAAETAISQVAVPQLPSVRTAFQPRPTPLPVLRQMTGEQGVWVGPR